MKIVFGLGSNVGNRLQNLRQALWALRFESEAHGIHVLKVSPIYESEALLPENAPETWNLPYYNLNILCETDRSPQEILVEVKKIEARLGRASAERWAPRKIDIDLLLAEDILFTSEKLNIPHLTILDRPFVLMPLADLVPDWKVPQGFLGNAKSRFWGSSFGELGKLWKRLPKEKVPFGTHRTTLTLSQCMGAFNITPDSFSDGGLFLDPNAALRQVSHLVQSGAQVIDIGAEATSPSAAKISQTEEWARLQPVLDRISLKRNQEKSSYLLSIDTFRPATAIQAIEYGIDWINDQSGGDSEEMIEAVARSQVDLVIMHHLELPENRSKQFPLDADPIEMLLDWGSRRIDKLVRAGIPKSRIIYDPGIGFGISPNQVWEVFRNQTALHSLGVRLLVGHSRKSFLKSITSLESAQRDLETSLISPHLVALGADYVRVHNADYFRRAVAAWTQLDGMIRYQ